ncbi:MAG: molybdopterin cofactor-binding domain-containing protein [Dehalococcoidia bacterium]
MDYRVLGHSLPKKEVADKVTGRIKYSSDLLFPDLLIGRILHSPHAHARILSIDISRAAALPGVKAVITHSDAPRIRIGRWIQDRYVLASDKVHYMGEPVVAVAAVDEETADEALELVRVEYQELPAVFDVIRAMEPTAPLVHEDLSDYHCSSANLKSQGNILEQGKIVLGDVESAWAQCYLIHEDNYRTPVVYQGFTQPHETTAAVDSAGRITVWASNKAPFILRQMLAQALNISMSRILIAPVAVGGDFGGKGTAQTEPICVLLAQKSGRPVRLSLSREEELTSTYLKEATIMQLKAGVGRDGTLVALQGSIIYETGAYSDIIGGLARSCADLHGPYRIPNVDLTATRVYTNNTPRGHMRAPTTPQPFFALESHMDMVARKLGMDPIEFRLRNAVDEGDILPTGQKIMNPGIKETLRRTREYLKREGGEPKPNEGWGIASFQYHGVVTDSRGVIKDRRTPQSSAWVKLNEDGSAVLITGTLEQGCGPVSIMAQIVAEVLGISYDDVAVVAADTDSTPFEFGTGASQTTFRVGLSVQTAAEEVRNQLLELAAKKMDVSHTDLVVLGGRVYKREDPEKGMTLADVAALAPSVFGSPILGTGASLRAAKFLGAQPGEEYMDGPQHGTHAVKVRVNPDTGKVRILKYYGCHDVGFAINPQSAEGQIEGGIEFGVGFGLSEEVIIREGKTLNPNLTDYRIPTAMDMPHIDTEMVEIPSKAGPFGAKGLGEATNVPVAPAIANAVYEAAGVRITGLPLTGEKVYQAMQEKGRT